MNMRKLDKYLWFVWTTILPIAFSVFFLTFAIIIRTQDVDSDFVDHAFLFIFILVVMHLGGLFINVFIIDVCVSIKDYIHAKRLDKYYKEHPEEEQKQREKFYKDFKEFLEAMKEKVDKDE